MYKFSNYKVNINSNVYAINYPPINFSESNELKILVKLKLPNILFLYQISYSVDNTILKYI